MANKIKWKMTIMVVILMATLSITGCTTQESPFADFMNTYQLGDLGKIEDKLGMDITDFEMYKERLKDLDIREEDISKIISKIFSVKVSVVEEVKLDNKKGMRVVLTYTDQEELYNNIKNKKSIYEKMGSDRVTIREEMTKEIENYNKTETESLLIPKIGKINNIGDLHEIQDKYVENANIFKRYLKGNIEPIVGTEKPSLTNDLLEMEWLESQLKEIKRTQGEENVIIDNSLSDQILSEKRRFLEEHISREIEEYHERGGEYLGNEYDALENFNME